MLSNKPKTLVRNKNDVVLSWKNVFNDEIVVLQMLDEFKVWKNVYWGKKTDVKIDHLAPCSCYSFRIRPENEENWVYFKSATDTGPFYLVMHMTRAILLGKTVLIRQIVHKRPVLLEAENKEHKTPLIQAIERDNAVLVHLLINLGANVNTTLKFTQRTPLMIALYRGHLQIASYLIDKGANIFNVDVNGLNCLNYAIESNCLDNVKFAMDLRIDINSKDRNGWSCLKRAMELNCSEEIVEYLITSGAD